MTKLNLCSSVLKMVSQGQITEKKEIMLENSRRVQNESKEIILDVLKKHPQRYSSLSNLGTFYIHKGQYDEGLKYLNKAIEINPKAHFEREKYQIKAVEYIKELGVKPPFIFPVQKLDSKIDIITTQIN